MSNCYPRFQHPFLYLARNTQAVASASTRIRISEFLGLRCEKETYFCPRLPTHLRATDPAPLFRGLQKHLVSLQSCCGKKIAFAQFPFWITEFVVAADSRKNLPSSCAS